MSAPTVRTQTSPRTSATPSGFAWSGQILLLAAAYYAFAQIGFLTPSKVPTICLFWPAIGVAVAVLYRNGLSLWPGVWLGAFLTNVSFSGPLTAFGIGVGTTAGTVLTVHFLRRLQLNPAFETLRDLRVLLAIAAGGALVSALVSTIWLSSIGAMAWSNLPQAAIGWWMGDLAGISLVAPLGLAWSPQLIPRYRRRGLHRELALLTLATFSICFVVFSGVLPNGTWSLPLTFLPIVCVAWAAASGRAWPAMVQVVVLNLFAIYAHSRVLGPCVYLDPSVRPFAMWAYIFTMGVIGLGLSGLLSERDGVERQLKAGQETYRAIVHDNPALICQFKTDGTLLIVNQTFRRAFQESAKVVGDWATRTDLRQCLNPHNFYEIAGVANDPAMLRTLRTWAEPEKPAVFDCFVKAPTGELRWYHWTARAVDMTSSVITEFHAVGLDITNQKRAEAERKAVEAQAIQTQQYEAIGVLAGGIAHEFNNILTSVLGYSDLGLMQIERHHRVRPMLEEIQSGAQRAAELTKQLMIYGGQTRTHPSPMNVTHLIENSAQLLAIVVPKCCRLRYDLTKGEAEAFADESKVRQLLVSLVSNAAEALTDMPMGDILVRTSSVSVAADSRHKQWLNGVNLVPGNYVELTVIDTGCGMDTETLTRIFQPFFTTKFPGRGLGLAAVLGIVQDHQGAIQVTSQRGKGTTVRVILPTTSIALCDEEPTPIPVAARRSVVVSGRMLVR